jgi:hypothetical protein
MIEMHQCTIGYGQERRPMGDRSPRLVQLWLLPAW